MLRLAAASLLIAATGALAASVPVARGGTNLYSELSRAKAEAQAARSEQLRLEQAVSKIRGEAARLRAQELAAAQAIAATEAQISAAEAQVRLAQAQLALQRQRLAREQAPVSALLGGLVLMARRPPVVLLADAGSPGELVKLRILLRETMPAVRARTAALIAALERGNRLEQAAIRAREELVSSRGELASRRESFARLEQRALEQARLRGSEALGAGDVALASEERLDELSRQAVSSRASAQVAAELVGLGPAPLVRPQGVPGPPLDYRLPADAPVIEGLGAVSASGVRSRGIRLATRRGTAIRTPASGRILFSGPFRDYDGVVIIDHGGGWRSVLVNAGSNIEKGAKVSIGDPLGIALGPLEVQLQRNGRLVSPALIAGSSRRVSNEPKGG
ncbi:MAG TPA: peptidoglycan DD-metalloendopeptidase family protein [Sphingomicrobium sp.]|nr:peptidoglycan DD-metalloendopeptidase family protein [Sphingomicrobium sp.]